MLQVPLITTRVLKGSFDAIILNNSAISDSAYMYFFLRRNLLATTGTVPQFLVPDSPISACSNTEVPVRGHAVSPSRPSFHFYQRLTDLPSCLFFFSCCNGRHSILSCVCYSFFPPFPTNIRYCLKLLRVQSLLLSHSYHAMLRIRHALITQLNLAMRLNVHLMGLLSLSLSSVLCHP